MEQPRLRQPWFGSLAVLMLLLSCASVTVAAPAAAPDGSTAVSATRLPAPLLVAVNGASAAMLEAPIADALSVLPESEPAPGPQRASQDSWRIVAEIPEPASLLLLAIGLLALVVLRERDVKGGRRRRPR